MSEIIVTTSADSGDGSLRAAIAAAAAGDVIRFDDAIAGSTITLSSALTPTVSLEIIGNEAVFGEVGQITLDGGGRVRIFAISSALTLTLRNLNLIGGKSTSPGGAIQLSRATARVDAYDCLFENNTARQGAAIYGVCSCVGCLFVTNAATGADLNGSGGAVCNPYATAASFVGCRFEVNVSSGFGGAFYSSVATTETFRGCVFYGNTAAYGGAVACAAQFVGCEFAENQADVSTSSAVLVVGSAEFSEDCSFPVSQNVGSTSPAEFTFTGVVSFGGFYPAGGSSFILAPGSLVGFESFSTDGTVDVFGSGFIALPVGFDVSSLVLSGAVATTTFGAGISDFTSRASGSNCVLSWKVENDYPAALLRLVDDVWSTEDAAARSPYIVSASSLTTYGLWDGKTLATVSASPISWHVWSVYDASITVDTSSEYTATTGYKMMSSYYNRGETPALFARITNSRTSELVPVDAIDSIDYTCFQKSFAWSTETRTPVEGHENVPVPLSALLSTLITDDPRWAVDDGGYNFTFEPDGRSKPIFPKSGDYVVVVTLHFKDANPLPLVFNIAAN